MKKIIFFNKLKSFNFYLSSFIFLLYLQLKTSTENVIQKNYKCFNISILQD